VTYIHCDRPSPSRFVDKPRTRVDMPSTRASSRPRADAAPPPCMPPLSTFQEVVLLLDASRTQVNTWSSLAAGAQAFCAILAACAPLRAARLRVTTFASTSTDVYVGPVRGAASNVDYDHAPSPGPAAPLDALVRALRKSPSSAPKLLVLVSGACVARALSHSWSLSQ